jgi:hypothetical protein
MSPVTVPPRIDFCSHPSVAEDLASFETLDLPVAGILMAWRPSLFSHEWLGRDGNPKTIDELGPLQREQRTVIEQKISKGGALPQPVIGVGVLECLEIGAGRDVLLTLAALGVENVLVHAPASMIKEIHKLLMRRANQRERGSVMIYLLIAIVLLALLTLIVSRSSRNVSTDTLSNGRLAALVSEQITYMDAMQKANVQLRLRGCTQSQMSFYSPQYTGCCNNLSASNECKVFDPEGMNITYRTVPTEILDTAQVAQTHYGKYMFDYHCLSGIGSSSAAVCTTVTSGDDLMMFIPFVTEAFCKAYNKKVGIALPSGTPPYYIGSIYRATGFVGGTTSSNAFTGVNTTSAIYGKPTGCIEFFTDKYYVYYVLEPF